MSIDELKNKLKKVNEVNFKLYSLMYNVRYEDGFYSISNNTIDKHIVKYNSIDELLDNYLIFGE